MILTYEQIKSIILDNPNKNLVKKGSDYNKLLRMHLYGEGLNFEKIEGYETQALSELKVKYARSNKDLFARLKRPIDKVYSARGGSVYYNLPDSEDRIARRLTFDVRSGYSIRKWVEQFWTPHLLDDPFGLVFIEMLPQRESVIAKAKGKSVVYPTYKSITSIYDYAPNGHTVDYVVFHVTQGDKKAAGIDPDKIIYRVVDDSKDYYVEKRQDEVIVLEGHTFDNLFMQVPAILNSGIPDAQNDGCVLSFFDDVIELANHFLMKGAIKLTHEFMHAYPKYWQYAEGCVDCNGTGQSAKDGDNGNCQTCKGTGKKLTLKVSDAMLLEFPSSAQDPIVTPNIAGYVSPDKTYYEIATADLSKLEEIMMITLWGIQVKGQTNMTATQMQQKTATEVMNDVKPQSDRLQVVSEMAEKVHKFILDGVIMINLQMPNYGGSSVNYGRRFMVESADEIWKKYSDARVSGAPVSVLEDLLLEYYEAKYTSDPVALAVCQKLMYVEPFIHHSVADVKTFMPSDDQWRCKLYFSEWLSEQSESYILLSDIKTLKDSLKKYTDGLQAVSLVPPEPKKIAA